MQLGRLAFRGATADGKPIFEQKRIDIQLAVDLMTLSFTHQIATAIVVTGDSDFIPVFEAVKQQAVRVVLCYGLRNPAHKELIEAADERKLLDEEFVTRIRRADHRGAAL